MLSSNMMAQQYFYVKFVIQLTFITNGLSLIDAPHRIMRFFKLWLHERNQKHLQNGSQYIDDYQFDLGYNQSYCLVIFLNCLLFSCVVPIIPLFACLYFLIKYQVDKYNLIFVYYKRYDSGGKMRETVNQYMVFNLYVYLIVMFSFFGLKFPDNYFTVFGIIITLGWTAVGYYIANYYLKDNTQGQRNNELQELVEE